MQLKLIFHYIIPGIIFFLFSCTEKQYKNQDSQDDTLRNVDTTQSNQINTEDLYTPITKDSLKSVMSRTCTPIKYEFIDLYPDTDFIPTEDYVELDDYLKKDGFFLIYWGRGNWDKGPRFFSITLQKDDCVCQVDKLYYSLDDSDKKFKVTERIKCYKTNNTN